MSFFANYSELFTQIRSDTLLITANQRMSRFLKEQWNALQQSQQASAWQSLRCMSLQIWLDQLWNQMLLCGDLAPDELKTVLSPNQQRQIWAPIVKQFLEEFELLSTENMVDVTAQAWQTMRLWQKPLNDLNDDMQETQLFKKCVLAYQQRCDELQVMDAVDRNTRIRHHLPNHLNLVDRRLVLIGFDNINPFENELIRFLEWSGIDVERFDVQLDARSHILPLPDCHSEIRQAACWAASRISSKLTNDDSYPRIGIVIPDLANLRGDVETIFTEVFEPQSILPGRARHSPVFNISVGQPLTQAPVITTAFLLLKGAANEIETAALKRILQSPFLWSDKNFHERLLLSQRLCSDYDVISVDRLCKRLNRLAAIKSVEENSPMWVDQLLQFLARGSELQSKLLSFKEWGIIFTEMLTLMGWPGQRTLDTYEFQQLSHWPNLLDELASLDVVLQQPVSWQQALSELNRIAYIPFHPQTESSPVQILGVLEAAGLQFDYLWIMGLDNRVWPEACKPNPLLPLSQQKEWCMPRASAERELALARQLTKRLRSSAYEVVFSYPETEADQPLQPSPLLLTLDVSSTADLDFHIPSKHCEFHFDEAKELVFDEQGPAFHSDVNIAGGTHVLKSQSMCPFKAFAEHRLQARNPDLYQAGVTPLIRGNFVHATLELIWREIQTQEQLKNLSMKDLISLLNRTISAAWGALDVERRIGDRVKSIEWQRTRELLLNWLEFEKQRQPFIVEFLEKSQDLNLGGLKMSVRVDRCDRLLASDALIVIDYKTGRTDIKQWFGDRPEEPQIPLYILLDQARIQGAGAAQINRHELELKGICADNDPVDSLTPVDLLEKWDLPNQWSTLVEYWQHVVETLAQEFLVGQAAVDPKAPPKTCAHCDLHNLCRIRETPLTSVLIGSAEAV